MTYFNKVLAIFLLLIVSALIVGYFSFASGKDTLSVEFGLAELSPNGESGGYAVPASGASLPTGLRSSCSANGTRVTLQWGASYNGGAIDGGKSIASSEDKMHNFLEALGVSIAYAGGAGPEIFGGGGSFGGGGVSHSNGPVTYNVRVYTNFFSRNGISGTSVSLPVTPNLIRGWGVQACAGGECSPWSISSFYCPAPPPPPPPPAVCNYLRSSRASVPYGGGNVTLSWSTAKARSASINNGVGAVPVNGSKSVFVGSNTTFTLTAVGTGGNDSCRVSVTRQPPPRPTVSLTADRYTVPYNTGTTLRWTSANATTCTASGVWSGGKSTRGSQGTGPLITASTYYIRCHNPAGGYSTPASATIGITYGTGADVKVNKKYVYKNETVTVTWNTGTSDPANCVIQTGSVQIMSPVTSKTGSFNRSVPAETTYELNCEKGNNKDSETVKVLPEFQET